MAYEISEGAAAAAMFLKDSDFFVQETQKGFLNAI